MAIYRFQLSSLLLDLKAPFYNQHSSNKQPIRKRVEYFVRRRSQTDGIRNEFGFRCYGCVMHNLQKSLKVFYLAFHKTDLHPAYPRYHASFLVLKVCEHGSIQTNEHSLCNKFITIAYEFMVSKIFERLI